MIVIHSDIIAGNSNRDHAVHLVAVVLTIPIIVGIIRQVRIIIDVLEDGKKLILSAKNKEFSVTRGHSSLNRSRCCQP